MLTNLKLSLLVLAGAGLAICIKLIGSEIGVFQQMAIRAIIGASIMTWFCRRSLRPGCRDIGLAAARGLAMGVVSGGLYIAALESTKTGVVCFLACLPYEACWALVLYRERPSLYQLAGLGLGVAGMAILAGLTGGGLPAGSTGAGLWLAALSGVAWAFGVALTRLHSAAASSAQVSVLTMWCSAFWTGLASLWRGEPLPSACPEGVWAALAVSCLAVGSLNWLSSDLARVTKLSTLSLAGLVQPIVACVLAYLILGEALSRQELIGGLCMLLAATVYESEALLARLKGWLGQARSRPCSAECRGCC